MMTTILTCISVIVLIIKIPSSTTHISSPMTSTSGMSTIVIQEEDHQEEEFINEWLVRVKDKEEAEKIASEQGYHLKKELKNFPKTFVFQLKRQEEDEDDNNTISNISKRKHKRRRRRRSRRESSHLTEFLNKDPRVVWAEQQVIRKRVKRSRIPNNNNNNNNHIAILSDPQGRGSLPVIPNSNHRHLNRFNDELWPYQWYLRSTSNIPSLPLVDLNIESVWEKGFTGRGIVVSVLDDGIEYNHTDLIGNYDPLASFDANDNDNDPFPRYDVQNSNSHGTKCAGEIAMTPNNKKCGVGIAFNSKIGGIRCLDGPVVDEVEAAALSFANNHIDVYSASWGPPDNGKTLDGPKRLAQEALINGVTFGRRSKGVIYVWAAGNGGVSGDDCNADGYVSSIFTLSIGAVTQDGSFPWYSEKCSSIVAVTYSSGSYSDAKVATTDLHDSCTVDHTGTSAAAPIAAAIIALLLESRSDLTWRDVQHLIVFTSDFLPLKHNPGWRRNSKGFLFNNRFGFGLLNANQLIETATNWTLVPRDMNACHVDSIDSGVKQMSGNNGLTFITFLVNDNNCSNKVNSLEHVQVFLDVKHSRRGSLDIFIKSPSSTTSSLISSRPNDVSLNGFRGWHFSSLHFWGESPFGQWTLLIRDNNFNKKEEPGELLKASLILYGTQEIPVHLRVKKRYPDEEIVSKVLDRIQESEEQGLYDQNTQDNNLNPLNDPGHLFNWNDYGYALIPLLSEGRFNSHSSIPHSYPSHDLHQNNNPFDSNLVHKQQQQQHKKKSNHEDKHLDHSKD